MPRKSKKSIVKEDTDYPSLLSYFTHILFESYYYPTLTAHGVMFCDFERGVSDQWWKMKGQNIMPFFEVLYHLEKRPDGIENATEEEIDSVQDLKKEMIERVLEHLGHSLEDEKENIERAMRHLMADEIFEKAIATSSTEKNADDNWENLEKPIEALKILLQNHGHIISDEEIEDTPPSSTTDENKRNDDSSDSHAVEYKPEPDDFQELLSKLPFGEEIKQLLEKNSSERKLIVESSRESLSGISSHRGNDKQNEIGELALEQLCFPKHEEQ